MATPETEVTGVFQGAIIIRSAIIRALQELRENPNLIWDALASLPQDDLTAGRYGELTIQQCIDWFTKTNCPVKLGLVLTQMTSPCVSVELVGGDEAEATIGDVDYNVVEEDPWSPGNSRELASVHARESYSINCFVQGEPEYVLFLDTLVRFGIFRHKEDLLDERGFARLTWSVGPAGSVPDRPGMENFFARTFRLNGYVRHVWPVPLKKGQNAGPISQVEFGPGVAAAVHNDQSIATSDAVTPVDPKPPGGDPFNPSDWEDRDILSGQRT